MLALTCGSEGDFESFIYPIGELFFKLETCTLLGLESVVADLRMVGMETVVSCRLGLNLDALGFKKEFRIRIQFANTGERIDILAMSERLMKRA